MEGVPHFVGEDLHIVLGAVEVVAENPILAFVVVARTIPVLLIVWDVVVLRVVVVVVVVPGTMTMMIRDGAAALLMTRPLY